MNEREKTIRLWFDMWLNQQDADTLHYAKEWITMANKEKRFETIYTQGTSLSIVVDTETGVNYLVHDTGITPLLDKNGTVVITEINK